MNFLKMISEKYYIQNLLSYKSDRERKEVMKNKELYKKEMDGIEE